MKNLKKIYKIYWKDGSTFKLELTPYHYKNIAKINQVSVIAPTAEYKIIYNDNSYSFATLDQVDIKVLKRSPDVMSIIPLR